ncbi:hypothetical protein EMO89_02645 [Bifidobacterium tissieri]|uniref:Uncharacterized protein n=1 Tax=Bifidobacterium tissieri TaxID=1630162 RepID=A0A5M9ZVK6_9BIFI|nr:hypothetical protein [Bifidobacterium tissieri]KAA8831641.1 hypothetical protein EMO89_02645 [Bifidobacterium tissieri]
MAGNGRRASKGQNPVLRADGKIRGRELGDPALLLGEDKQWNPKVLQMWDNLRRSPQAQRMGTDLDWDYGEVMMIALNIFFETHRWEMLSEVRQWMAKIGYSPADRNALKFDAPAPDDLSVGPSGGDSSGQAMGMDEYWGQLSSVLDDGGE